MRRKARGMAVGCDSGMGGCEPGLVSIIVPVYNAKATLSRCLASLERQTYAAIEVLIMDDGSSDGSLELCRDVAHRDERFSVHELSHGGVAAARNAALALASGEYLMFADADDIVDDRYVERLLEVLLEAGTAVATCIALDVHEGDVSGWPCNDAPTTPRVLTVREYNFKHPSSHRVIWGAIYRRSAVGGLLFDETLSASTDTLWFAQVLARLGRVAHVDERLYCYVMQSESISKGTFGRKNLSDLIVWKRVAGIFSKGPELPFESACETFAVSAVKDLIVLARRQPLDAALVKELARIVRFRYDMVLGSKMQPKAKARHAIILTAPVLYWRYLVFLNRKRA